MICSLLRMLMLRKHLKTNSPTDIWRVRQVIDAKESAEAAARTRAGARMRQGIEAALNPWAELALR